jgi:adenylate cyclase
MKRREFIAGLGGAAIWPLVAHAQQPVKLPTIGFLGASSPEQASSWLVAFVKRLRQLNPVLRVSTLKDVLGPYRRAEDLSRYEEGLRRAGAARMTIGARLARGDEVIE